MTFSLDCPRACIQQSPAIQCPFQSHVMAACHGQLPHSRPQLLIHYIHNSVCRCLQVPTSMPKYKLEVRTAAALAYYEAKGNLQEAIKMFEGQHPIEAASMPRPDLNIKRWAVQLKKTLSLHDKPRSGRPRKVPKARLLECITAMKRARRMGGVMRQYESMKEAMQYEPVLRDTCTQYGVKPQQLLKAMHKQDPKLARAPEKLRRFLDQKHRRARVRAAKALLRQPQYYYKQVFWLDAKHLYIVPPTGMVYCDAEEMGSIFVEDPNQKPSHPLCLNYYALVNWFAGAVDLVYVSGTSKKKVPYQVGSTDHHTLCASLMYFH